MAPPECYKIIFDIRTVFLGSFFFKLTPKVTSANYNMSRCKSKEMQNV